MLQIQNSVKKKTESIKGIALSINSEFEEGTAEAIKLVLIDNEVFKNIDFSVIYNYNGFDFNNCVINNCEFGETMIWSCSVEIEIY